MQWTFIQKIRQHTDKIAHMGLGTVFYLSVGWINPGLGVIVAVAGGVLIEMFQEKTKTGEMEGKDAIATIIGGLVGLAITITTGQCP